MLKSNQKIAIFMEQALAGQSGKMGHGVMRYIDNPIVCVIDSEHAGKRVNESCSLPYDFPVVATVGEASALGAEVLVLGIAPSGGRIPDTWLPTLEQAVQSKMSIVNGLHDALNSRFADMIGENQWIWDIRKPEFTPSIGTAKAATLDNHRILFVGTDMVVGKMTAGLELYRWMRDQGVSTKFLATGQIGISIAGSGIPLDAFKVDHACGAVETMVMQARDYEYVFVEGQGSLLHPGSTATLPLMRGSCPTHLILCHRSGMDSTRGGTKVPPLGEFLRLNEAVATCCGSLPAAKTIGVALNTMNLSDQEAAVEVEQLENELHLPVTDVVRFGAEKLGTALLNATANSR